MYRLTVPDGGDMIQYIVNMMLNINNTHAVFSCQCYGSSTTNRPRSETNQDYYITVHQHMKSSWMHITAESLWGDKGIYTCAYSSGTWTGWKKLSESDELVTTSIDLGSVTSNLTGTFYVMKRNGVVTISGASFKNTVSASGAITMPYSPAGGGIMEGYWESGSGVIVGYMWQYANNKTLNYRMLPSGTSTYNMYTHMTYVTNY